MKKVELLSPAKDLEIGIAAINNGADAVYIGASVFGARKAAGNSIEDIARLTEYAHRFYCRVFVTLNTILYDDELAEAEKLIHQLYRIGVDALIVQDMGILKLNLPPIALHASTQTHNYDLERIKFLDRAGFQRIVLARELSLEQIRTIRKEVKAELEVFVHGALCVSLSGQCYLSQYMFGRSANRGECAQPCRMKWSVCDSAGKILVRDKYILSLKDLNLSAHIAELIEAGVDSFKIEGRLKDENYVANVTNHYSSLLNQQTEIDRTGSGQVMAAFAPAPERSFNRGYSDYFVVQRKTGLVNMDTPKSMGKKIGVIRQTKGERIQIEAEDTLHNGDGLCYLENGELKGVKVNQVDGDWITCNGIVKIKTGTVLFRNYDHHFVSTVEKVKSIRKIRFTMEAECTEAKLCLKAEDEDGIVAYYKSEEEFEVAQNLNQKERLCQQLTKCGDSDFECTEVHFRGEEVLFIPAAVANSARRQLLENLGQAREEKRPVLKQSPLDMSFSGPVSADWHYNIVNRHSEAFYREHGVQAIETGFEKNNDVKDKDLMNTRYCILYELGKCRKNNPDSELKFPLWLYNDKQRFGLEFDCSKCFMKVKSNE